MNILDTLFGGEHAQIVDRIAREANLSTEQISNITQRIFPLVSTALQARMSDPSAMGQLMYAVMSINMNAISLQGEDIFSDSSVHSGGMLLHTVFGSEEAVSELYDMVSSNAEIHADVLKKVIPVLMTALVSVIMQNGGALTAMLGSLFTNESQNGADNDFSKIAQTMLGSDPSLMLSKLLQK